MLISPSLKAEVLFLMDMQEREVLFYQESETLTDLNPVFAQPSMTPFIWVEEKGLLVISSKSSKSVLATVQRKLDVVNIVQPSKDPYWQCSVTSALDNSFRVDGCWAGVIVETTKLRGGIVNFEIRNSAVVVARSEWRNSRDVKLSVDDPSEDPIVHIALILAIIELKKKK